MPVYTETLADGVVSSELTPVGFGDNGLTDTSIIGEDLPVGIGSLLSERIVFSLVLRLAETPVLGDSFVIEAVTPVVAFQAGALVAELIKLHGVLSTSSRYSWTVEEAFLVHQLLLLAIPKSLTEGFTIEDLRTIAQAVTVLQRLALKDSPIPIATYGLALVQAFALNESLANFFGGELSDALEMAVTIAITFQAVANPAETMTLADVLGNSLLFSLQVEDDFEIDDVQLLQMLYNGDPLLDTISMSAAYVDSGGNFTTWAINTRTGAVTEYQNFVFNSITKMGNQYLGANSEGLWLLDGELDAAANIPTRVKSGWMQPSGSKFTSFKAAYLGLRVRDDARDFFLKLHSGDGREYVYAVKPNNMQTTKINMGKGLRSRYFSFELVTTGADYDLDSLEFVPLSSYRRV